MSSLNKYQLEQRLEWKNNLERKILEQIEICPRCDNIMTPIQACHLFCFNCGAQLTCDEKGTIW